MSDLVFYLCFYSSFLVCTAYSYAIHNKSLYSFFFHISIDLGVEYLFIAKDLSNAGSVCLTELCCKVYLANTIAYWGVGKSGCAVKNKWYRNSLIYFRCLAEARFCICRVVLGDFSLVDTVISNHIFSEETKSKFSTVEFIVVENWPTAFSEKNNER